MRAKPDKYHQQRDQGPVTESLFLTGGHGQRPQHQHRGNASAHGRFGQRHVDGVQVDQEAGRKQAVDAEQHDDGEQIAHEHHRQGGRRQQA